MIAHCLEPFDAGADMNPGLYELYIGGDPADQLKLRHGFGFKTRRNNRNR